MATTAAWMKVDQDSAITALRDAVQKVEASNGDVMVDFSSVRRIDAGVVRIMEELATRAEERGAKIALRGVNVTVYKVLKLVKLSSRFMFLV